ncbi:Fur family transcriptional regulator [Microbacterium allomyrinae]|uniref:Transcriptional repressor n=1 Tax=Microbacterium allomyrinae TaxID=2830666 RepID=A0A9X1LWP6_9MICO|nr:Fur family transcriptional regulator [Microbacterium allomyrinae]MCC2033429.1 transcriptional repressor [Microbacterium allomyrinae]
MTTTPAIPALDAAERLRHAGLRVTDSRRAVVAALGERPHASADELFAIVARSVPGTSLQSVYNALGDFVDAGLVRRIEPAGRPGLFELRVDDNHHHLICSQCGAVQDVDCVVGAAPCLTPSDAHGYALQAAEVTFWGVCPDCAAASAPSRADHEPAHLSRKEAP